MWFKASNGSRWLLGKPAALGAFGVIGALRFFNLVCICGSPLICIEFRRCELECSGYESRKRLPSLLRSSLRPSMYSWIIRNRSSSDDFCFGECLSGAGLGGALMG